MRSTDGKRGFHFSFHSLVQRWPKQCVLGCVIPPLATHASSRNLGHIFLANSSMYREVEVENDLCTFHFSVRSICFSVPLTLYLFVEFYNNAILTDQAAGSNSYLT